jgi:hypothetical protein
VLAALEECGSSGEDRVTVGHEVGQDAAKDRTGHLDDGLGDGRVGRRFEMTADFVEEGANGDVGKLLEGGHLKRSHRGGRLGGRTGVDPGQQQGGEAASTVGREDQERVARE